MFSSKGLLFFVVLFLLVFAGEAAAGSNANAVLSLDLIADGGTGNQTDDGVTSGTISGQGTKIAVEVFAKGVTTALIGVTIEFDFDASVLKFEKAENSVFLFVIPEATGATFASITPVTLPASGFLARAEFTTAADVTDREFSIGIKRVVLAESGASSDEITTTKMISFNASSSPDFDGDGVVGVPDFLLFVNHFGSSRGDGTYQAKYDLDGNGMIGIPDFLIFVDNFGKEVSSPKLTIKLKNDSNYTISTGVIVVHNERFSMNYLGRRAPAEYESLAEVGDPSALIARLEVNPNIYHVIKTDVLEPNSERVLTVSEIAETDRISYMAMITETNDGVVWGNSFPIDSEFWTEIIDMGTEQNSPIGSGFSGGQPDPTQGANNIDNGIATNEPVFHHSQFYDDPDTPTRIVRFAIYY